MNNILRAVCVCGLCHFLCLVRPVAAQNSLQLADRVVTTLVPFSLPVSMSNASSVEAYKLAITYDTALLSVSDVNLDGTNFATEAEGVFLNIYESIGGFTLGAFLDYETPFDGQVIPPGQDTVIASIVLSRDVLSGPPIRVAMEFTDGILNNPPVDNALVLEGIGEVTAPELTLVPGSVTLQPPSGDEIRIEDFTIAQGESGVARVLLTNPTGPVDGFTVTIRHPDELNLSGVNLSGTVTEEVGAEFVMTDVLPTTGSVSVVFDALPPFDGQALPSGSEHHIVNFRYHCQHPFLPDPPLELPLMLVEGDVSIQIQGFTVTPALVNGTALCEPVLAPDSQIYCGQESATGEIVDVDGSPGETLTLSFFYVDSNDAIAAFSLAVRHDCLLHFVPDSFTVDGTAAVAAEFVNSNIDDDPDDGDGCEFTAGVLMDALPPFEGQTIPPSRIPAELARVDVHVDPTATPGRTLPLNLPEGPEPNLPVSNTVVIDDDIVFVETFSCSLHVVPDIPFVRGDCDTDGSLSLEDGLFLLNHLFLNGPASPCPEACNADGQSPLGIIDAVFVFSFLFTNGPAPPPPHPACGILIGATCEEFSACP